MQSVPGGCRVGGFPPGWAEWNDRFRDTVRAFWKGDEGTLADLAMRLTASGDLFNRGRKPRQSCRIDPWPLPAADRSPAAQPAVFQGGVKCLAFERIFGQASLISREFPTTRTRHLSLLLRGLVMSIPSISGTNYVYTPPADNVSSPHSETGTSLQQQQQTRVYDHAPAGAKSATIEDAGANTANGSTRLGSILDVTV